jgi:DNA-binding PadR family transcriptional regulator
VEPSVLLLLADGQPKHGYDILEVLREDPFSQTEVDTGIVYRTLRALEANGMATSEWAPGSRGPKRRVYTITDEGREHLADWAVVLERFAERTADLAQQLKQV